MKKIVLSLLSIGAALTMTVPVFAVEKLNEEMPILISPISTLDKEIDKLIINGNEIELNDLKIWTQKEQIMVPLRLICEELGFEVTWNNEDETVYLDNDEICTTLSIGVDSYYKKSSKAMGLTQSFEFGVAPVVVDGSTYVPVQLFSLLYSNNDVIVIKDTTLSISNNDKIQIPSPIEEYKTINEAEEVLGFDFKVPNMLPNNCCNLENISVISNTILQLTYTGDKNTIVIRVAKTNENISGDFAQYSSEKKVEINNLNVVLKGSDDIINNAVWYDNDTSYSIYSKSGITQKDITLIIENIK